MAPTASQLLRPTYTPGSLPSPTSFLPSHANALPLTAATYKQQGNQLRLQHQLTESETAYRQALQQDATYVDVWFDLGDLYLSEHRLGEAIHCLQQVLLLNPDDDQALLKLGDAYEQNGQPWQALMQYQTVLNHVPNHDVAHRRQQYLLIRMMHQLTPKLADSLWKAQQQFAVSEGKATLIQHYEQTGETAAAKGLAQVPVRIKPPSETDSPWPSVAEYDAVSDQVRVIPELLYADRTVLAAYLAHEMVHKLAHQLDKQNATSIDEEYRAYIASEQFWQTVHGRVVEPNLDYALNLWQQGQLRPRVKEVYQSQGVTGEAAWIA